MVSSVDDYAAYPAGIIAALGPSLSCLISSLESESYFLWLLQEERDNSDDLFDSFEFRDSLDFLL